MIHSKLIELLRTFDTSELRAFNDFLKSPFFNKNEDLVQFYRLLRKFAPDFPEKKIRREVIFKKMYPKAKYSDKQMNYLMNFTLKLAEKFIGYRAYEEQEVLENYHVLDSYISRNLDKHYKFILRKTQKSLDDYPYRDTNYYYYRYLLADIDNKYFLGKKMRKYDDRLQFAADNLDIFYLANKLKLSVEMQDRKKSIAAEYDIRHIEAVQDWVDDNIYEEIAPVQLYNLIYSALSEPEAETHFTRLKSLIKEHEDAFPSEEIKDIYFYAINYCIRMINSGQSEYLNELFELYKNALDSDLLIEKGHLSPWAFKNIIKVALRLKDFDWTEEFIHDFKDKLAAEFRDNAFHYNLGDIYYYRKEFDKALDHLNQVEFSDIYYALDTKKLLIKIYYEQNQFEPLWSLIASFKAFLQRSKVVSTTHKKTYQNFLSVMQKIVKAQPEQKEKLIAEIKGKKLLPDRNWLLGVVEQL